MKILGYFLQVRYNCGLTSFGKCDIIAMFIGGYGGIGRRVGFRFRWATVQVQLLLPAPSLNSLNFFTVGKKFGLFCFIDEFENFNP